MPAQCHAGPVPWWASAMAGQCHASAMPGQCHARPGQCHAALSFTWSAKGRERYSLMSGTEAAIFSSSCFCVRLDTTSWRTCGGGVRAKGAEACGQSAALGRDRLDKHASAASERGCAESRPKAPTPSRVLITRAFAF